MAEAPVSLNPAQLQAVHHLSGPCLVLAGAGSGKTRVIVHKIARLLQAGLAPKEIAAITFTNKAAQEMRERAKSLVGARAAKDLAVSTFHSLGVRILREDGIKVGLKEKYSILDADDVMGVLREAGGARKRRRVSGEVGRTKGCHTQKQRRETARRTPNTLDAHQHGLSGTHLGAESVLRVSYDSCMHRSVRCAARHAHRTRNIMQHATWQRPLARPAPPVLEVARVAVAWVASIKWSQHGRDAAARARLARSLLESA